MDVNIVFLTLNNPIFTIFNIFIMKYREIDAFYPKLALCDHAQKMDATIELPTLKTISITFYLFITRYEEMGIF